MVKQGLEQWATGIAGEQDAKADELAEEIAKEQVSMN